MRKRGRGGRGTENSRPPSHTHIHTQSRTRQQELTGNTRALVKTLANNKSPWHCSSYRAQQTAVLLLQSESASGFFKGVVLQDAVPTIWISVKVLCFSPQGQSEAPEDQRNASAQSVTVLDQTHVSSVVTSPCSDTQNNVQQKKHSHELRKNDHRWLSRMEQQCNKYFSPKDKSI